ncbi:hypothetical protein [Paenibacillus agricola]|uniref:Uncharacterized protein n=1 Tax=Paenibacillus agricola TaxID=2716264 RepID=A0ABX0JKB2_9BACL|nr:hypothetical protein [Paenibacillus agricola]NHN34320.1 hypothetical protein [Paenibacillus agricola]
MKRFDDLPKSVKKAVRYIKQEATMEQLNSMEPLLLLMIGKRKQELLMKKVGNDNKK